MEEQIVGFLILGLIFVFIVFVISILILVFFNLNLQKAMKAVSEKNQKINPALIWLNLIPIPVLNQLWTGYFCIATCQSIDIDAKRKIAPTTVSIIFLITSALGSLLGIFTWSFSLSFQGNDFENQLEDIGAGFLLISGLLSMINFVFFIIVWVSISNARKKLEAMGDDRGSFSSSSEDILDAPM